MFNNLIASGPGKRKTMTPGAMSASVAAHLLLLAGAVYASIGPPPEARPVEEEVTFLEVQETQPEPPPPPEAPPEAPPPATPPPPQGFQELIPPVEIPDIIPDVDLSALEVDPADFSGIGVAGGVATGVEDGVPQNTARDSTFAFEVAVLDSPPAIANARDVQRALTRLYPRMLLNAGIQGTVQVQFVIQPDGSVDASTVRVISASNDQFSGATVRAIEEFRFRPGIYRGEPVRVLIEMPIQWRVGS